MHAKRLRPAVPTSQQKGPVRPGWPTPPTDPQLLARPTPPAEPGRPAWPTEPTEHGRPAWPTQPTGARLPARRQGQTEPTAWLAAACSASWAWRMRQPEWLAAGMRAPTGRPRPERMAARAA